MNRTSLNGKMHVLLAQLEWIEHKAKLADISSNGRTESTKELTDDEFAAMLNHLEASEKKALDPSRRKILYYARELGMETPEGKADYPRINQFIQEIGARNPKRRKLYQLHRSELNAVLSQVEAIYKKEVASGVLQASANAKTK